MSSAAEHQAQAEHLIGKVTTAGYPDRAQRVVVVEEAAVTACVIAAAQVYATLAVAAAVQEATP